MTDLNDLRDDSPSKLSRRRVVAGTAWAVPIVMGVGAAPAWAVSTIVSPPPAPTVAGKVVTITIVVSGWKNGDSVTIGTVTNGGTTFNWATGLSLSGTYSVPTSLAGNTATFVITGKAQSASGNKKVPWNVPFTAQSTPVGGILTGSTSFSY